MSQKASGLRSWQISCLLVWIFASCRAPSSAQLDASPQCQGKFGKDFAQCIADAADSNDDARYQKVLAAMKDAGGMGAVMAMGPVMTIKHAQQKGLCLHAFDKTVQWSDCSSYAAEQQFHFINQVNVRYKVHPTTTHDDIAFRLALRHSVNTYQGNLNDTASIQCLVNRNQTWGVGDCDQAPYFIALPNRHDDDEDHARWEQYQYTSLVALLKHTGTISKSQKEWQQKVQKQAEEEDVFLADLTGQPPPKPLVVDLGSLEEAGGCSAYLLLDRDGAKAGARCPKGLVRDEQNADASTHVFLHSCGLNKFKQTANCQGLNPIKKFNDFATSFNVGAVVQILPKKEQRYCLQAHNNSLSEIAHCDKNSVDNHSTQFRLQMLEKQANGDTKVKIRSLERADLCVDLKASALKTCNQAPTYAFNALANDLVVTTGSTHRSYFFQTCVSASSHKKSNAHDCRREVPWRYKLYEELSIWLGIIPLVGIIPSYVMDGLICGSGQPDIAPRGCLGLGLGIAVDALTGDFMSLSSIAKWVGVKTLRASNFAKVMSQSILAKTAGNPLTAASGFNVSMIHAIAQNKFNKEQLSRLLQDLPKGHNCGGGNCAAWWMPYPQTPEQQRVYLQRLLAQVQKSSLSAQDKTVVRAAIEPLLR